MLIKNEVQIPFLALVKISVKGFLNTIRLGSEIFELLRAC